MTLTRPVFVDRSGRRRRLLVWFGGAGGAVLLLTALALVVGFTGTGQRQLPGLPPALRPAPAARPAKPTTPGAAIPTTTRLVTLPATTRSLPTTAVTSSPAASPSRHRTVPTQTPSHPGKGRK